VGGARPEVVALASYHCAAPGGAGAVREVCDRILAARALRPTPRTEEERP